MSRDSRGRFLPGPDPDRHALTREERSRGGRTTFHKLMMEAPWMLKWLQRRIDRTRGKSA